MGVGIEISGVTIYRASDSSYRTYVNLPHANSARLRGQQYGQIKPYANGILRLVKGPTRSRSIEVVAHKVPRRHAETLDGWAGDYLVYRDAFGRALWGTYLTFTILETIRFADPDLTSSVQFNFQGTSRTASEFEAFRERFPDVVYPVGGYGLEDLGTVP